MYLAKGDFFKHMHGAHGPLPNLWCAALPGNYPGQPCSITFQLL